MEEDNVTYNDHDFPLGYKLIPCGYLILPDSKNLFKKNGLSNKEEGNGKHWQVVLDEDFDVDGCIIDEEMVN